MKPAVLFVYLLAISLCGCSWLPRAGPSASEVAEQGQGSGQAGNEILFDIVDVDARVVSTLRSQPRASFRSYFKTDVQPPDIKIAVGDTVSVLIWESAAGGLFIEAPPAYPATGARPTTEPLAPESPPPTVPAPGDLGLPNPSAPQPPEAARPRGNQQPSAGAPAPDALATGANAATAGRPGANIPDQQVGPDGGISIPYAGRIPAAGRSPAQVQQTIEERLAQKALEPQVLVIVKKSAANTVTVTGETKPAAVPTVLAGATATGETAESGAVPISVGGDTEAPTAEGLGFGAKVPLSPGGDRMLQVIAVAGGTKLPVHETFVRLSRNGVTVTIPMARLVSDPAEDIYAQPGDVLTLVRVPQTFSVFGGTGQNAEIPFNAEGISLGEALAKSKGLRDDLANPQGVFLFRYEPDPVVRALNQPIATRAPNGSSPIAYRFNFKDGNSYFLADQFPVHDKDIIFVAGAPANQAQKFFTAFATITGPVITGLVVCRQTTC